MSSYVWRSSNLIGREMADRVLAYALDHAEDFERSGVGAGADLVEQLRRSVRTSELGDLQEPISRRVLAAAPGIAAELGLQQFQASGVELELISHGHAGFYSRHIDVFTRPDGQPGAGDRMISVVCYAHATPRPFSGGELRLYPHVQPERRGEYVDIEPAHGSAVAFSTWVPHEVRPVRCESGRFRDSRFSINCWVLKAR